VTGPSGLFDLPLLAANQISNKKEYNLSDDQKTLVIGQPFFTYNNAPMRDTLFHGRLFTQSFRRDKSVE